MKDTKLVELRLKYSEVDKQIQDYWIRRSSGELNEDFVNNMVNMLQDAEKKSEAARNLLNAIVTKGTGNTMTATKIIRSDQLDRLMNNGAYVEVKIGDGDEEEPTPVIAGLETLYHMYSLAEERDLNMVYSPFDPSEEDGAVMVRVVESQDQTR